MALKLWPLCLPLSPQYAGPRGKSVAGRVGELEVLGEPPAFAMCSTLTSVRKPLFGKADSYLDNNKFLLQALVSYFLKLIPPLFGNLDRRRADQHSKF